MKQTRVRSFAGVVLLALATVGVTAAPLVPPGWDPALAGDDVMAGLVTVTAPQVKGAHDADMVLIGDHAYIVAMVNEEKPGEHPAWPEIYAVMVVVRLSTKAVETIVPFARSEQAFENETLPVGSSFVPRVIRMDEGRLRCYWASEQPGERQSQMYMRDFDIATRTFEPRIQRAKIKTSAGLFDMQPRIFHDDAARNRFTKPAKDYGLYFIDSFKVFDGRTYAVVNNFAGKQNAFALVHEDRATFEILGHMNEPQTVDLSEASVNRLPDGTWMAILRQDGGNWNYYFTTSRDGRTWTEGRELPFVPNGGNSKPSFDTFGDVVYLGWQESTKIHGVSRSVFNIDISLDGKSWERKYRFETAESFQYPTFREYNGAVWLCATQGRKERITFGKLEDTGTFVSQAGRTRTPPPPPPEEPAVLRVGVKLFTDRPYELAEVPESLRGLPFLRASIETSAVRCVSSGTLFAITPTTQPRAASQEAVLQAAGFEKADIPEFQLFPGEINRVSVYRKDVRAGDVFGFRKFVLFAAAQGVVSGANAPAAGGRSILPADWKPVRAGDEVLRRLIRVSAPHVKGAHDAEFVCVGDRAYIVEHDNDIQPGHGAGAAMYCVLSVVHLPTLAVEKVIPMARSGQEFENEKLGIGACFVPRILQKDEHTLRTYFEARIDGNTAAQIWYRDFDLRTQAFENRIHRAKLKTSAGVFDMQALVFHADAVAHGLTKPAKSGGFYIFDSFKRFDDRTYVALNNYPGKQNALALLHDDRVTFEIVGHYNEPQSQQLSESSVHRLPDGMWMAILRNDGGNYHFTTSKDGRTWSVAREMPFVTNGANSKPTFNKFGEVYYLGWQDRDRIDDCGRSVFNLDVSRDGLTWERKYRFETPESFQYPTFHEHQGVIWLTVSQSDHKGSSDRIMFGKLEEL